MIYCFGDSWGAGAELEEDEKPFVHWLAKDLDKSYKNFSNSSKLEISTCLWVLLSKIDLNIVSLIILLLYHIFNEM